MELTLGSRVGYMCNDYTAMSLEAVQKLSIPELLQVLGEKLGEEYSRVRGIPPSSTLLASLEPEVRPRSLAAQCNPRI